MPSAETYKAFPPVSGNLRIPTSSRAAALAGLSLYTPCRAAAIWAHRIAWQTVALFGSRVIPGAARAWTPPIEPEIWRELCERWQEFGTFDSIAVLQRTQPERSGVMVLVLQGGSPVSFVKVAPDQEEALDHEARALALVQSSRPASFLSPRVLGSGEARGWWYLATTPLPVGRHRPHSDPPLLAILDEVQAALAALPRSPATPDHWRPMHGDFTPWNLRLLADGGLVLLDWENASWGPPGADEVLYRATAAALCLERGVRVAAAEAISFWEDRISRRTARSGRDRRLKESLLAILRGSMNQTAR